MLIKVLAIGRRMPGWVQEGVDTYARRLPRHWRFEVQELAQSTAENAALRKRQEADKLSSAIPKQAHVVVLDERGKAWTTEQLSQAVEQWQSAGQPVAVLIGGPDGLDPALRRTAHQCWSLSALTLPHPLVRVLLTEQLYRAHTLLTNHPYHRA